MEPGTEQMNKQTSTISTAHVVDEVDEQTMKQKLLNLYNFIYAHQARAKLFTVAMEECNGCQTNHPIQSQHTCLTLSELDQLEMYFAKLFSKVKFEDVFQQWQRETRRWTNISKDYLDNFSVMLQCDKWRQENNPMTTQWKTSLYLKVKKLIVLDKLFSYL